MGVARPSVQMSSSGWKSIGTSSDCKAACLAETQFTCMAYTWAGEGTNCYLHGEIDTEVLLVEDSQYNLYEDVTGGERFCSMSFLLFSSPE